MKEGLANPEEIFQLYLPWSIIGIWEKYHPIIMRNRISPNGEVHTSDAYKGYELLYNEAKERYPNTPPLVSPKDATEHTKLIQEHLQKNPNPN